MACQSVRMVSMLLTDVVDCLRCTKDTIVKTPSKINPRAFAVSYTFFYQYLKMENPYTETDRNSNELFPQKSSSNLLNYAYGILTTEFKVGV